MALEVGINRDKVLGIYPIAINAVYESCKYHMHVL